MSDYTPFTDIAFKLNAITEDALAMSQRRAKIMLVTGLCWGVFAGFTLGLVLSKFS